MSNYKDYDGLEETLDTDQLDALEEERTRELLLALVAHILNLQKTIVTMRQDANASSHSFLPDKPAPYPDLYSDLCPSFADFPAYRTFKNIIQLLE